MDSERLPHFFNLRERKNTCLSLPVLKVCNVTHLPARQKPPLPQQYSKGYLVATHTWKLTNGVSVTLTRAGSECGFHENKSNVLSECVEGGLSLLVVEWRCRVAHEEKRMGRRMEEEKKQ